MAEKSLTEQLEALRHILRREQQHGRNNPALIEAERTMTRLEKLRHDLMEQPQDGCEAFSDRLAQEMLAILNLDGVCS